MNFDDNNGSNDDEQQESQYQKRHPVYKVLAVILLLTFISLSVPQISLLLNNKFDFLNSRVNFHDNPELKLAASAVVSIEAYNEDLFNNITRKGTGFNISDTGLIVTNQHIVQDAKSIKIEFEDGKVFYSDTSYSIDNADIALLTLDAQDLPFISLQTDTIPEPGVIVSVIGNPLGFKQVILQGPVIGYYKMENIPVMLLNIDCQSGNSGSPVINEQGQVIGIVYAVTSTRQGEKTSNNTLSYPIYYFKDYLGELNET